MTHESKFSHLLISAALTGLVAQGWVTIVPRVIHATAVQSMTGSAATDGTVHVSPEDFSKYFNLNQDTILAGQPSNGHQLVTLTPNQAHQVGNFTLNNKIDMDKSFTLTGQLNLGDKSQAKGGADGVSIIFHPGPIDETGVGGEMTGFGGIPGAFGFKWDTYHNPNDPAQFTNNESYAAFVHNDEQNTPVVDLDSAQKIANPTNNQFIPVKISYDGSTHMMTVTYGDQTFSRNLSNWIGDSHALALSMTASTGEEFNLQQFNFESFDYTPTVVKSHIKIEYQDATGSSLQPSTSIEGAVNSPFTIQPAAIAGYQYQRSSSQLTGNFWATDQTIVLTYKPITTHVKINYLDQNGKQLTASQTLTGEFGTTYQIQPTVLPGYTYMANSVALTGTFGSTDTNVNLIYQRLMGHVKVVFMTSNHHPILPSRQISGYFGDDYQMTVPEVKGFTSNIKVLSGRFNGAGEQVEVIYTPIKAQTLNVHLQIINHVTGQVIRVISLQGKVGERISFNEAYYLKILAQYGLQPMPGATWPQAFVISNTTANNTQLTFNVVPVNAHANEAKMEIINNKLLPNEPQVISQTNEQPTQMPAQNKALLDVNNLMRQILAPTLNQDVSSNHKLGRASNNQAVVSHKRTLSQQPAQKQTHSQTPNKQPLASYLARGQQIMTTIQHKLGFSKADQLTKKMPVNSPSPSAVLPTMETPSGGGGGIGGASIGAIMGALATSTSFGAR